MTLAELKAGQSSQIIAVGGEGPLRRRLLDMGLTPKTRVLVRKIAPMGDPIEICLRGYELTLRQDDAAKIEVSENRENDICAHRQSELRKNDAVQPTDGVEPARRKFSRGHRR